MFDTLLWRAKEQTIMSCCISNTCRRCANCIVGQPVFIRRYYLYTLMQRQSLGIFQNDSFFPRIDPPSIKVPLLIYAVMNLFPYTSQYAQDIV